MVEGDAGAHGHAFEGVVGDVAGDADLLGDEAVEVAQEGGATRHHDPSVHHVGGELRRGALEDGADGADDRLQGVGDALRDVGGGDGDGAREAADLVAAADLVGELLLEGEGAADGDLQLLGGAVADDDVVAALDVVGDGVIEAVARDADGLGDDDAVHGDDRGLGSPAADVDDGGLIDDDATAFDVDEDVGGAEVYADALTEHGEGGAGR